MYTGFEVMMTKEEVHVFRITIYISDFEIIYPSF